MTESQQELLALAAKAAGYEWDKGVAAHRASMTPPKVSLWIPLVSTAWNPLANDEDALRLAVRLKLMVSTGGVLLDGVQVQSTGEFVAVVKEPYGDDACAATRLAITRAAAEIGRQMP